MITKKPLIDKNGIIEPTQESINKSKATSLEELLAKQVDHEFANEALYFAMSVWCTNNGYYETAKFFEEQSKEERAHAVRFINFIAKRGMKVPVPTYEEISKDFVDIKDIMQKSLAREIETTKMIQNIHNEALKTSDLSILIADEFLKEQMEEEQLFISMINLVDMCNNSKIDFEMEIAVVRKKGKYKIGEI